MGNYIVLVHYESLGEGLWRIGHQSYCPDEALRMYALYLKECGEDNVKLVVEREVDSIVDCSMTDGGGWIKASTKGAQLDDS